MLGIQNIAAFVLASVALIVVPGPATLFVAARAQIGSRHAMAGALGIVMGDVILMFASGLGLSSAVTRWPSLFMAIRILGAIYIGWLGISAILSSSSRAVETSGSQAESAATAKEGLLLTLMNPKPILFFAAFFPLFISARATSWAASFAWLGVLYELLNVLYYASLILAIGWLKHSSLVFGNNPRRRQMIGGFALLACAALVLVSSDPAAGV